MTTVKSNAPTGQDKFRVAAKTRMFQLGLSVTALSKELGLARVTVSQAINQGIHLPSKERIATHLGISLS